MGIRVHKALGFGLMIEDAKPLLAPNWKRRATKFSENWADKDQVDPVITKYQVDHSLSRYQMIGDTRQHLNELSPRSEYPDRIADVIRVVYSGDMHLEGFMFIPPSHYHQWWRESDSLDWHEMTRGKFPDDDVFWYINEPVYPYSMWMHPHNGKVVTQDETDSELPSWHISQGHVPYVPEAVRCLVQYSGFFKDADAYLKMRPWFGRWWH